MMIDDNNSCCEEKNDYMVSNVCNNTENDRVPLDLDVLQNKKITSIFNEFSFQKIIHLIQEMYKSKQILTRGEVRMISDSCERFKFKDCKIKLPETLINELSTIDNLNLDNVTIAKMRHSDKILVYVTIFINLIRENGKCVDFELTDMFQYQDINVLLYSDFDIPDLHPLAIEFVQGKYLYEVERLNTLISELKSSDIYNDDSII